MSDPPGRKLRALTDQQLAAIVDSSDDAILVKDLHGVIHSWNRGAEKLFGYTADEVIGKPVTVLIPPDREDEEPRILRLIASGDRLDHYRTVRCRKDGSLVDIWLSVTPIRDTRGQVVGATKVAREITRLPPGYENTLPVRVERSPEGAAASEGAIIAQPRMIARNHVTAVHAGNALTAEVPLWDAPRGILWWVDIQGQRLLAHHPASAREEVWNLPLMPGLTALCRDGRLLIGLEDGLYPFDPEHGLQERLVAVEADDPRTRINDGKPDPAGRLWFGTVERMGSGEPIGRLYRLDTDGRLTVMRQNVRIPNAIAFAPDGRTFYFADSRAHQIEAFAYDAAKGELGPSRVFARYGESEIPDGTCVDAEGALWIAVIGGGRIERRLADGTLDTIVEVPVSRPTMPMLGGADGRTLFVTSQRRFLSRAQLANEPLAGDLIAVRVDVQAAPVFAVVLR